MKRHATFTIPIGTRNLGTTQTARNLNLDTFGTQAHGILDCSLHCTTEHDATLELGSNAVSNQLGIQFRLANLFNIDVDRHAHHLREIATQLFYVFALLTDHNTRTRSLDCDVSIFCRTLDLDATNRSCFQLFKQEFADFQISQQIACILLGIRVPSRGVLLNDAQANPGRMYFLTHLACLLVVRYLDRDMASSFHDSISAAFGPRLNTLHCHTFVDENL